MSTLTQFRQYLISQDAAGANIELIRSAEQVCVLTFDAKRLCFVQCHVLLEPLRNRAAFEERGSRLSERGHPLAARVLEFGEDDGSPFYITENVDGETLKALISRHDTLPVWLAQRLTSLALAAQRAVMERGDFGTQQPLESLRVLQVGARELRVVAADYRIAEVPGARTGRGRQVKSFFDKQAQFISSYLAEQGEKKASGNEAPTLNTADFSELLHNLLLACSPDLIDSMETLRRKLETAGPQPPAADIAAPYKPRPLLAPQLASYQEVARCAVQSVRVQSQRLDPGQPYALRGTLMKTGQNVFVEQVAPPLLAGMVPGEALRQARSQPKGGKFPNLVPVIFVEENEGVECMAETAVEGVTLAELLASRGTLDPQESYLVLAGVDSALAQLEKAARIVRRLRLEDIFLFTGFGQGRSQDSGLLTTKLNEWPGFSIVLRAHPCLHSMAGRGTDPAMLLPTEPHVRGNAEPIWNGGWMAALGSFLIGTASGGKPAAQGAGVEAVSRMFEEELAASRQGSPNARSNFLARFVRVLRENDLAQMKGGGFWQEVTGSTTAQGHAAEVARAATAEPRLTQPPPSRNAPAGVSAPLPSNPVEPDDAPIGFAEALIRGTAGSRNGAGAHGTPISARPDSEEEEIESSWSGFREEKPLWTKVLIGSLIAIALGGALAHLQGRALWQQRPSLTSIPIKTADSVPTPPQPAPSPLLPPPSTAPKDLPPPKPAVSDTLVRKLKQMRLAGEILPGNMKAEVEKAAQAGNTEAMLAMGNVLMGGEPGPDEEKAAFGWYQKAMQAGDNNARVLLAQCYLQGWGTPADHPRAVGLLTAAAKADDGFAKDLLGVCYARGLGVARDDAKAFQLCTEAHEAGIASACGNLGTMYLKGQGVAPNALQAVRLFMEGAKKGNAESMLQYARCLEAGNGVTQDATEATSWYRQAAKLGNAEAQAWCQEKKVAF